MPLLCLIYTKSPFGSFAKWCIFLYGVFISFSLKSLLFKQYCFGIAAKWNIGVQMMVPCLHQVLRVFSTSLFLSFNAFFVLLTVLVQSSDKGGGL